MGPLGGAPEASARATGAIDVFWRGSGNNRLWSAAFRPGHRWAGPLNLHGHLASIPFPLLSAGGRVHVFWKGTDHQLWQVSRGPKTGWGRPYRLRMGRLRAGPFGAIGPGGKSVVFWRGKAGASVVRRAGVGQQLDRAPQPRRPRGLSRRPRLGAAPLDRPIAIPPRHRNLSDRAPARPCAAVDGLYLQWRVATHEFAPSTRVAQAWKTRCRGPVPALWRDADLADSVITADRSPYCISVSHIQSRQPRTPMSRARPKIATAAWHLLPAIAAAQATR